MASEGRVEAPVAERPRSGDAMLPRYERPREAPLPDAPLADAGVIPFERSDAAIAASDLSEGSKRLVRGLLRLGGVREFPGGGIGIEYGSLLKTAARPEYVGAHVAEAAAHLRERRVDVLMVPGMSGYPIGAMYAVVAGIPAVLLKKAKLQGEPPQPGTYPPGSFAIPSYTGEGDVVISADLAAVQDIVDGIVAPQLDAQRDVAEPTLSLRVAGADDIIDKATMSQAVSESALVVGRAAIAACVERRRRATGDRRPVTAAVEVVAWVTPLIKGYNRPHEHLARTCGVVPFAGVNATSVHLRPQAIGVEGVGVLAFATES